MSQIGSHCSYCGTFFSEQKTWPRVCRMCGHESYKNPIPVVVTLVPVYQKLVGHATQCSWLIEQRGIEPHIGGWALPGGYIDSGESWQQAAARELREEVSLVTKPEDFCLYEVLTDTEDHLVIFGVHKGVHRDEIFFQPNSEVLAVEFPILPSDKELCFKLHNEVWHRVAGYYNSLVPRESV